MKYGLPTYLEMLVAERILCVYGGRGRVTDSQVRDAALVLFPHHVDHRRDWNWECLIG